MLEDIGLFDMDGSLADYIGQLQADLLKLQAPSEGPIEDLWLAEKQEHISARMRLIKSQVGWWRNLAPIEAGMRAFMAARELGFINNVLTKGPRHHPNAWQEKVEWCRMRLGHETPVHITEDKGLVYGKFLYDDFPEYCLAWLRHRPRGLVIMPVNQFNSDFRHPQVVRYDGTNLEQIKEAMRIVMKRKVGEPLLLPPYMAEIVPDADLPAVRAAAAAASSGVAAASMSVSTEAKVEPAAGDGSDSGVVAVPDSGAAA